MPDSTTKLAEKRIAYGAGVLAPRDWTVQPQLDYPAYGSTRLRRPTQALVPIEPTLSELTGPFVTPSPLAHVDSDLTRNGRVDGEPIGERIVVSGRVLDERGKPIPRTLIEVWQANAAGRYAQRTDKHDAPLDPNFYGSGRCITDNEGAYSFTSIRPGPYPWSNHYNAWRPAHIHVSLFGPCFATRLITQFYFPGDPLLDLDPIFNATPARAQNRLIARYSLATSQPNRAMGYEFDIVLRGADATPMEV
ncbi:MAG: protocatechuate 3,4-dioxygenase subunit beta [Gammaproteobacteria bacterium]